MKEARQLRVLHTFTQAEFDRFAHLSGDDNSIHVDQAFAARSRFGRTVAHGLLLFSVVRGLVDRLCPGAALAESSLMFPAPTFAEEEMSITVSCMDSDEGVICEFEIRRLADETVTCQGSVRVAA